MHSSKQETAMSLAQKNLKSKTILGLEIYFIKEKTTKNKRH